MSELAGVKKKKTTKKVSEEHLEVDSRVVVVKDGRSEGNGRLAIKEGGYYCEKDVGGNLNKLKVESADPKPKIDKAGGDEEEADEYAVDIGGSKLGTTNSSAQSSPSIHDQRNLVCNSIFSPELLADADDDFDSAELLAFTGPVPSTPINNATHSSISTSTSTKTNSNMGRSLADEEHGGPVPANLDVLFQLASAQCAVESPTRALATEDGAKVVSGENKIPLLTRSTAVMKVTIALETVKMK
mmetsp:Transcript_62125/g.109405  ORF Transcript_62125/g.109405 Transcript_62125/m.109405 type:complete len:243 (-) Transcript_62125:22-750(-)